MKRKIIIAYEDNYSPEEYINQIKYVFGDLVEVSSVLLGDKKYMFEDALIVVITYTGSKIVENYIEYSGKVSSVYEYSRKKVILKTMFTKESLNVLKSITAGTRAVFSSPDYVYSTECICILKRLGITHINMIPYTEDISKDSIKDIDMMICYGDAYGRNILIENCTTIGWRQIQPESYYEIASLMGIDFSLIDDNVDKIRGRLPFAVNIDVGSLMYGFGYLNNIQMLIDIMPIGVLMLKEDGTIDMYNRYICNMLSLNSTEMCGKNVVDNPVLKNLFSLINKSDYSSNTLFHCDMTGGDYMIQKKYLTYMNKIYGHAILISECESSEKDAELSAKYNLKAKYTFDNIIGVSRKTKETVLYSSKYAQINSPVLIIGDTGTGKELYANSIHNASTRRSRPFITVNCTAIPDELLESELFGYEKGSFTGASSTGKKGLFEIANGGTIFLDEIGDASPQFQMKVLRVLQEREITKIGSYKRIPLDIRIIAATNKTVDELKSNKTFRRDLFYRLSSCVLKIPSLTERREDIPLLCRYFLDTMGYSYKKIDSELMQILCTRRWEGNIRELKNCVEQMGYFGSNVITSDDLPIIYRDGEDDRWKDGEESDFEDLGSQETVIVKSVLKILRTENCGRRRIVEILNSINIDATEHDVRKIMDILNDKKYIVLNKGRKGSSITRKGIEWVDENS